MAENADDVSAARSEFVEQIESLTKLSESQKERIATQRADIEAKNQRLELQNSNISELSTEIKRLQGRVLFLHFISRNVH